MSRPLTVNWILPIKRRDYNRMPASVWIRCLQLLPYLEERGIRSSINSRDYDADVNVFVRSQSRGAYRLARKLSRRGQRVVVDLCVNYFDEVAVPGSHYGASAERVQECKAIVSVADAVTCASRFIARRAGDFHPRVRYLPDSIDSRHFCVRKRLDDFKRNPLRAIWCFGKGTGVGANHPYVGAFRC